MIDAHCHLDDPGLEPERVVAEARAVGVSDIVMAGVDAVGWRAQRALAGRFTGVHMVFGIHPQVVPVTACEALETAYVALEEAIVAARPFFLPL